MKTWPLVEELRGRGVAVTVIASGQHTSLLKGVPLVPDHDCGIPATGDPMVYAAVLRTELRGVLGGLRPDLVLVQGDTATCYAGAMAANDLEIPVGHVEAGIRTHDICDPWPEEYFRVLTDRIATYHFCPTQWNKRNLTKERIKLGIVTGNTGIDALYRRIQPVRSFEHDGPILVTLHRRESHGEPLQRIVAGVVEAAWDLPMYDFVWPVHPNPEVGKCIPRPEDVPKNFLIRAPLEPDAFVQMLARAPLVITDSGGVQEEAAALGTPAIVCRNVTDRPESVKVGLAKLLAPEYADRLPALILDAGEAQAPSTVFGDGKASTRIADALLGHPELSGLPAAPMPQAGPQ
jgi:UDP-N-acetylglucosamine 2-epimerase (non-hydrolysing)